MPYFPYLYARQAELRAVETTTARYGSPQQIWPVLEPVDLNNKLANALTRLTGDGRGAYVIINPSLGSLAAGPAQAAWAAGTGTQVYASPLLRPTFKEGPTTTIGDISAFVAGTAGRPSGLVLTSNRFTTPALSGALAGAAVTIFAGSAPALASAMTVGAPVLISDNFHAQARNADYSGVEWLSNSHIGHATGPGFSDYTILPAAFVPGGGPAGAAAIHLTYQEPDDSFWVQHFVSDETDRQVGTFQTKLLEAIAHLDTQITATPARFATTPPVATYLQHLATGVTTNPSGNKTLQIAHHLHTVANYMGLP